MLRIDWTDGGAVRAAHVVVVDLEHGNRSRLGVVGEDEVSVRLVSVGPRGSLLDADQAGINRARDVLQRPLEQQVGAGVADLMILERVKVEELLARRKIDRLQLRLSALALQRRLDACLREASAERDVEEPQRRVLVQEGALVGEVPRVAAPLLKRDVADARRLAEEQLGGAALVARGLVSGREVLVEIVEARPTAGDDQRVRQDGGAALG